MVIFDWARCMQDKSNLQQFSMDLNATLDLSKECVNEEGNSGHDDWIWNRNADNLNIW